MAATLLDTREKFDAGLLGYVEFHDSYSTKIAVLLS